MPGTRRTPYWVDTLSANSLATGGVSRISLLGGLTAADKRGMTVIRLLIHIEGSVLSPNVVLGHTVLWFGIGVASTEAFALGVTALPDPQTGADRPARGWLYRDFIMLRDNTAEGESTGGILRADIRAMRKVDDGELFLQIVNQNIESTGFSTQHQIMVRTLYKMA